MFYDDSKGNYEQTYWSGKGRYQAEHDQLSSLIPDEGPASTTRLNLLRVMANYYYDLYNNGLCNRDLKRPELEGMVKAMGSEIAATGAATEMEIATVLAATEYDAEMLSQELIDAFEHLTDACVLVAKNEKPALNAAAAPELLAALEALLDSSVYADGEGPISIGVGGCDDNEHREIVARAKAAIAKAKGTAA